MTSEWDVCKCDHARTIHKPYCIGAYADGKWIKNKNRDCNCAKFVLEKKYQEPESCPTCGRYYDD